MTNYTWADVLTSVCNGENTIQTAPNGIPVVAVNAPVYELMQLMAAITSGYNTLVLRDKENKQRVDRIRKLAKAHFPAEFKPDQKTDGWVSVEDMLPPKSGFYLCWDARHPLIPVYGYDFSEKYGLFNAHDHTSLEQAQKTAIKVTHWHPTPLPPAGAKKEGADL